MKEMKTFAVNGGEPYEIVDAAARQTMDNFVVNASVLPSMQISGKILSDNPNTAIPSSSSGNNITALNGQAASNIYPCRAGDILHLRVFVNGSTRVIFVTYNASGRVVRRLTAAALNGAYNSFPAGRIVFEEGETSFRVAHSQHDSIAFHEYVAYQSMDRINAQNVVTPDLFGAAGDGAADDTAPIQAMFDWAFFNSAAIRFPSGRLYRIGGSIVLREYSFTETTPDGTVSAGGSYSVEGSNYSTAANLHAIGEALFVSHSYAVSGTTGAVNAKISCLSITSSTVSTVALFKRIQFVNESLLEKIKALRFHTIFEASTISTCSILKDSTFWAFRGAFMTGKALDASGAYTVGAEVGLLADSYIVNCYISGSLAHFPVVFDATHADSDALISKCFIEFCRYVLRGGYANGFGGLIFSDCNIQYCYRLSAAGMNLTKFNNCYITSFSAEGLRSKITWAGLEDVLANPAGLICVNVGADGYAAENLPFNAVFDGTIVHGCDAFIRLPGKTGDFSGVHFEERGTVYRNMDGKTRVLISGAYDKDSWFDSLNHAVADSADTGKNAFAGQILAAGGSVYYGLLKDGSFRYVEIGRTS